MALKDTFYGTTENPNIKPKIAWSAVQSVENNYSDITATLTYSRTNSGYTTGGYWSGSLSIGDSTGTVSSKYIEITRDSDTLAITHTARVDHDKYGKLSVEISATGKIPGSSLSSTSISQEVTLDTIPRASTVSGSDANIESCATVVISRKNDAFTHSVAYQFGELSGYIDADGNPSDTEKKLSATTLNFLLPESFYLEIPDSPTGKCTLTCRTYSGSTRIGEDQTAEFTVTAAESLCAPDLDWDASVSDALTEEVTGSSRIFVQHISTALCKIRSAARHGASIVETSIDGVAKAAAEWEHTIENIQSDTVVFRAKDSRGYEYSRKALLNMVPYLPLTNNATVQRTDPTSGDAVLILEGTCWNGSFGNHSNAAAYDYSVNGGDLDYDHLNSGEDHKYQYQIKLTGLDYTKNHKIEVTVTDRVMSVTKTLTVQKGVPVFDWGEGDFSFHVPVDMPGLTINGQSLESYIRSILAGQTTN